MDEINEIGGLTHSGRYFIPEELRNAKLMMIDQSTLRKLVDEEEAKEFLKIITYHIIPL